MNCSVFLNSYNNLSSTLYFIDINKKFGTLLNVALLKGFFFDSYQLGGYILQPWMAHLDNVLPLVLGYLFFAVIVTGIAATIFQIKDWLLRSYIAVFAFFFVSLATDMWPLTYLTHLIQLVSPTYEQAFRNAFTKFSIGTSFIYSVFLGLGVAFLVYYLAKKGRRAVVSGLMVALLALVYYAAPTFTGHLLYSRMMVNLPPAYQEVMDFFSTQPDGRIADFPQECSDGWFSYNWGYFGSGFYWYGIKQPFLSRTFDVWSKPNENYYWEITTAIKNQNNDQVDAILQKYNANWVLYDPNELYCRNQKGVFLQDDLIHHIQTSPHYHLVKQFTSPNLAPISLYVYDGGQTTTYIKLTSQLPNVGPEYNWNNLDLAASTDYQTTASKPYSTYYPFRSLFTNRKLEESEFAVDKTASTITFTEVIPQGLAHYTYTTPAYQTLEPSVPVAITATPSAGSLKLTAQLLFPAITLDGKSLAAYQPTFDLGIVPITTTKDLSLLVNNIPADKQSDTQFMSTWYFGSPLSVDVKNGSQIVGHIDLSNNPLLAQSVNYQPKVTLPDYSQGVIKLTVPIVDDNQTQGIERFTNLVTLSPEICRDRADNQVRYEVSSNTTPEYIRLHTTNTEQCLTLHFPNALTSYGYLGEIDARTIQGNAPTLSVFSANRLVYNEETIAATDQIEPFYFILPPTLKNELGYSVQFANDSENEHESTVDFAGMGLWAIPYNFMKNITFTSPQTVPSETATAVTVTHPSSTQYTVTVPPLQTAQTLLLSQTYEAGWHAYVVSDTHGLTTVLPFLFEKELPQHTLINNWENGWTVPKSAESQIIILFFLPQVLQYLGFGLLLVPFLLALLWRFLPFVHRFDNES